MHFETGNQLDLEIIAYHGWGFDSGFWKNWKKIIPPETEFKTADRGYFFSKNQPSFSNTRKWNVLFTHSFGLQWCSEENLKQAHFIIIFNGFKKFHPLSEEANTRSKKVLQKMISGFQKNPELVVRQFWKNTFSPQKIAYAPTLKFNKNLLLEDLRKLDRSDFDIKCLSNESKIISIEGGKDKILMYRQGKAFTENFQGNAVYHFIKEAGHGLPVTHLADCWSFINAMIPIFQHNGNYRSKRHQ